MAATPRSIGCAADDALDNGAFRAAAEGTREEIERLPGPETVVPLLEQLTVDG
ncbi:MAG: hypothetical protein WEE66_15075 [Actinomycetota bacterium]